MVVVNHMSHVAFEKWNFKQTNLKIIEATEELNAFKWIKIVQNFFENIQKCTKVSCIVD